MPTQAVVRPAVLGPGRRRRRSSRGPAAARRDRVHGDQAVPLRRPRRRVRGRPEGCGLTAPSGRAPLLQYDDPRAAFEAAKTVGLGTLIDPHHPAQHWQSADDIRSAADRMNRIAAAAAEFDLASATTTTPTSSRHHSTASPRWSTSRARSTRRSSSRSTPTGSPSAAGPAGAAHEARRPRRRSSTSRTAPSTTETKDAGRRRPGRRARRRHHRRRAERPPRHRARRLPRRPLPGRRRQLRLPHLEVFA